MLHIRQTMFLNCSAELQNELLQLSYGPAGNMTRVMKQILNGERPDTQIIYGMQMGKTVGWCANITPAMFHPFHLSEVYIYVDHEHRREGIGTDLLRAARIAWGDEFRVCPHDMRSKKFFTAVEGEKEYYTNLPDEWLVDRTDLLEGIEKCREE